MFQRSSMFTRGIYCVIIIILICTSSGAFLGSSSTLDGSEKGSALRIIQRELSYFGGINSVLAVSGDSSIGILYPKENNPQNLHVFTTFSQKIANVEIYNRRGVLIFRDDLILQNTFITSLLSLNEFVDENNNSLMDPLEAVPRKAIYLIDVPFIIKEKTNTSSSSADEISYRISFSASDIEYFRSQGILEELTFLFEFTLQKGIKKLPNIPTISIFQKERGIIISKTITQDNVDALSLNPRLKFSCNISGWDYQYPNSKLILKVDSLSREQIFFPRNFSEISVSSELLRSTGLLGRLRFDTDQISNLTINHESAISKNYENQRFVNSRFSVGNSMREFLNFTWSQIASVDGVDKEVVFQPLRSEQRNILQNLFNVPFIILTGGFVFPQGSDIFYDPELQIMELNPIIEFLQVPNRSIIKENSAIILISGFFIGIIIIMRSQVRKKQEL